MLEMSIRSLAHKESQDESYGAHRFLRLRERRVFIPIGPPPITFLSLATFYISFTVRTIPECPGRKHTSLYLNGNINNTPEGLVCHGSPCPLEARGRRSHPDFSRRPR